MRACARARVCACEVHKCSTCHSSFRGSYLGEQGHLAEPALLRGRRISVATRCRFDSRYPLACRDMTPCHCARRIKHSMQRASSSLASFLRRKKNFLFSFPFSSVTNGVNMAEALSLEGDVRNRSGYACSPYLPTVNAPYDESPRGSKMQSCTWEWKYFG